MNDRDPLKFACRVLPEEPLDVSGTQCSACVYDVDLGLDRQCRCPTVGNGHLCAGHFALLKNGIAAYKRLDFGMPEAAAVLETKPSERESPSVVTEVYRHLCAYENVVWDGDDDASAETFVKTQAVRRFLPRVQKEYEKRLIVQRKFFRYKPVERGGVDGHEIRIKLLHRYQTALLVHVVMTERFMETETETKTKTKTKTMTESETETMTESETTTATTESGDTVEHTCAVQTTAKRRDRAPRMPLEALLKLVRMADVAYCVTKWLPEQWITYLMYRRTLVADGNWIMFNPVPGALIEHVFSATNVKAGAVIIYAFCDMFFIRWFDEAGVAKLDSRERKTLDGEEATVLMFRKAPNMTRAVSSPRDFFAYVISVYPELEEVVTYGSGGVVEHCDPSRVEPVGLDMKLHDGVVTPFSAFPCLRAIPKPRALHVFLDEFRRMVIPGWFPSGFALMLWTSTKDAVVFGRPEYGSCASVISKLWEMDSIQVADFLLMVDETSGRTVMHCGGKDFGSIIVTDGQKHLETVLGAGCPGVRELKDQHPGVQALLIKTEDCLVQACDLMCMVCQL